MQEKIFKRIYMWLHLSLNCTRTADMALHAAKRFAIAVSQSTGNMCRFRMANTIHVLSVDTCDSHKSIC